ncbi:5408_t:CDS:1, partial [Entrophospora sp. SA101]
MTEADNPETIQSVCKKFEAMLKQQSVIDSGSECPIITYEVAKKLGFEKDKSLSNITDKRYLALLSKWQ